MRILFVSPSYYPHIGGLEYVVKSVAERLAKLGHDTVVLTGESATEKPYECEINKVRVIRWPSWTLSGAYHVPKQRRKLKEVLNELVKDVDVIHAHSTHAVFTVWTALAVKRISPAVRLVFTPHYHGTGHSAVRKLLWIPWRAYVARLMKTADVIHAVSPREARLIERHYPVTRGKTAVIPNGIEEDVSNHRWQGADSDYMMYAGRVERYKRLELAVDLAREMRLKLLVVGRGPHRERLRKYAQRRGAAIELLDPQPRERYLQLLAGARYAVNPSRHEAYSMFVAEALAMGVPAAVTPEIAENLQAEKVESITGGLLIVRNARILAWGYVISELLRIYNSR